LCNNTNYISKNQIPIEIDYSINPKIIQSFISENNKPKLSQVLTVDTNIKEVSVLSVEVDEFVDIIPFNAFPNNPIIESKYAKFLTQNTSNADYYLQLSNDEFNPSDIIWVNIDDENSILKMNTRVCKKGNINLNPCRTGDDFNLLLGYI